MGSSFSVRFGLALIILFLAGCKSNGSQPEKPEETGKGEPFSAVWITGTASSVLQSRANIREAVALCAQNGIHHIFVVVWNQGRTLYPSQVMEQRFGVRIADAYKGRDPLQEMITEAHQKEIKVHAWFEYGFAASYNENGGLILQQKPEWSAKDAEGNLLKKNGFEWMNAFHPDVQDFMISLVTEVVENYDVDGVQGDDRMPAMPSTGGYDAYTVSFYKEQHGGVAPPSDYKDPEWVEWRVGLLTDFQGRLYRTVKEIKPDVLVSCAPSVHPWAKNEYLQDWPAWLDEGYADLVIPQVYRYDITAYQATLQQQLDFLKPAHRAKFYPGVLLQNADYNPSTEFLQQMIDENRRQGIHGESFWFFEGLKKFPDFFEHYRKQE